MIKTEIKHYILELIRQQFQLKEFDMSLEVPKQFELGHFATACSFNLAKKLKKSPHLIAEDICLSVNNNSSLSELFHCKPLNGYVNIFLTDEFLFKKFSALLDPFEYPASKRKICLEYVSANPTGPLHIGHGRWAVLGSCIFNILSFTNHNVHSEFYVNNVGNQIKLFLNSIDSVKHGYSLPDNAYQGDYINQLVDEESPVDKMIEIQKNHLLRLGVQFDHWFFESDIHGSAVLDDVLNILKNQNYLENKDSALWFKSVDFGDDKNRVLVKSDHEKTYFFVDIGYHLTKITRGYDHLINILGADHHGYVSRIKAGVDAVARGKGRGVQFDVIIGQLVSLMRNGEKLKMSKRSGDLIMLNDVIDEIGVDATRYFLIDKSADTHIEFDLSLAKKQSNDNPVFYIQYAHARMCRILEKNTESFSDDINYVVLNNTEAELICNCLYFRDIVWDAALTYSPYKCAQYAYKLAKMFHSFYEKCPIMSADEPNKQKRLKIVKITKKVLAQTLALLGISQPSSM